MKYTFSCCIRQSLIFFFVVLIAFLSACSDAAKQAATSTPSTIVISNAANVIVVKQGSALQLEVTGGSAPYRWGVDNDNATISDDGILTGKLIGKVTVTVTDANGESGRLELSVISSVIVLSSINIIPNNSQILSGESIQFSAEGEYSDQTVSTITDTVTWVSSNPSILSFSDTVNGLATANPGALDTVAITAFLDKVARQTTITIVSPIVIASTGNVTTVDVGNTLSLSVSGGVGPYKWSVDNSKAEISNVGKFTALEVGAVNVSVSDSSDNIATIRIDIIEPTAVLQFIEVTPADSSLFSGRSLQFTAMGTYSDSSTRLITNSVVWSSSNSGVVSFPNNVAGQAIAASVSAPLAVEISATMVGSAVMPGRTMLSILVAPKIIVSTNSTLIEEQGANVPFSASGGVTPYSWQVSDSSLAKIDNLGVLSPLKIGTVVVTATDDNGFSGSLQINITGPLLGGLFADPQLQTCVESYAAANGFTTTDQILTLDLYCNGNGKTPIVSLSGVENLTNLIALDLGANAISDIAPLSSLTNLISLNISNNKISVFDDLATLSNLATLKLSKNIFTATTSLASLSFLLNLSELHLVNATNNTTSTGLTSSSMAPISNLFNLKKLFLTFNNISDVSFLSNLVNLNDLQINNNAVEVISGLAGLINLVNLDLSANTIFDISALGAMTLLEDLNLRSNITLDQAIFTTTFSPPNIFLKLKKLDIGDTRISDISTVANFSSLNVLASSYNFIVDVTALSSLAATLTELDLSTNEIANIAPLDVLTNLTALNLRSNKFTTLAPLTGLTKLTRLNLSVNTILTKTSFSVLNNMPLLANLNLGTMAIVNIPVITGLTNLKTLRLEYNAIVNVNPLSQIPSLEYLYLNNNNIGGLAIGNINQLVSLTAPKTIFLLQNIGMSCDELTVLIAAFNTTVTTVVSPEAIAGTTCTAP